MERHSKMLNEYSKKTDLKKKESILFNNRKEVNINSGGTSGYTIKEGPNKGKVLGHYSPKSNNNF
tara:strand:- start:109 stop:303 length:195 start_codon:yes stop_codon:yes gene_type:complete